MPDPASERAELSRRMADQTVQLIHAARGEDEATLPLSKLDPMNEHYAALLRIAGWTVTPPSEDTPSDQPET